MPKLKYLPPYKSTQKTLDLICSKLCTDAEVSDSINHLTLNDHHLDPLKMKKQVSALWDIKRKLQGTADTENKWFRGQSTNWERKSWIAIITACLPQPSVRAPSDSFPLFF